MMHYCVRLDDPHGHTVHVTLSMPVFVHEIEQLQFKLPVWIPGSYLVREYAKHVQDVKAQIVLDDQTIHIAPYKTDKHTWQLNTAGHDAFKTTSQTGQLELSWRVYCWDLSVRGAHVDAQHAFFNGSCLFCWVPGKETERITLRIERPKTESAARPIGAQASTAQEPWVIACALPAINTPEGCNHSGCAHLPLGGFVEFAANDYEMLIDSPFEIGPLNTFHFDAHGAQHVFAAYGAYANLDIKRICADLKRICASQIELFEPQNPTPPFERYVFLVHATLDGYGGLEHENCTALLCRRSDLPSKHCDTAPEGYESFLGLCSHEYFHAWLVKRIRPAALLPYNLAQENYTQLLWVFEGFTSYYDDLMLLRCGLMSAASYAKSLGKTIGRVLGLPSNTQQTLAESSWDAWIKYYRPDENAPNALVSYYAKGALVALCLDAHLRSQSKDACSLDDVMRVLWRCKGKTSLGLGENELPDLIASVTGIKTHHLLNTWCALPGELPIAEALACLGYAFNEASASMAYTGLKGQWHAHGFVVKQVYRDSPAHHAGISAGDTLIALDGWQLSEALYQQWLKDCKAKSQHTAIETGTVLAFRAGRCLQFELTPVVSKIEEWVVTPKESSEG